jgi:hypothetical protein
METDDFLKGGQCLQRLWLSLTANGLSLQPMAAVTLFWLRWQLEGPGDFSNQHQALLGEVWGDYGDLFPGVDLSKEGHVMLFRMGYGKEIEQRTYRRELDSFFV